MFDSLWPLGLQLARLPCPLLSPRVVLNSCLLSQWCYPTISSFVAPISSCPQCFATSGSLPVNLIFPSGGQSPGASALASIHPMIIQCWFSLGMTGLIFLLSKGLSRVSSRIRKHQFFGAQPSLCPALTSEHDYWKNHSLDYMDLCQQSNVSSF